MIDYTKIGNIKQALNSLRKHCALSGMSVGELVIHIDEQLVERAKEWDRLDRKIQNIPKPDQQLLDRMIGAYFVLQSLPVIRTELMRYGDMEGYTEIYSIKRGEKYIKELVLDSFVPF